MPWEKRVSFYPVEGGLGHYQGNSGQIPNRIPYLHPKEDRVQAWVMRGAQSGLNPQDIEAELLDKFQITAQATAMTHKRRENGSMVTVAMPLYQILIGPNIPPEKLLQARTIDCFRVTWERKRNKPQLTQCFNCQRFGHGASNCGMKHRCVKCNLNHKPGECSNTDLKQNALCVNCGQPHPANYRECPVRLQYLSRRLTRKVPFSNLQSRLGQPRLISHPSLVQEGVLYSQAQQTAVDPPNSTSCQKADLSPIERLMNETQRLFGSDIFSVKDKCVKTLTK